VCVGVGGVVLCRCVCVCVCDLLIFLQVRPNLSIGDTLAGLHAALGATLALLGRERSANSSVGGGGGDVVDVAIYEAVFNLMEGVVRVAFTRYCSCRGFCTRILAILCKQPLCSGTPPAAPHRPHYCAIYHIPPTSLHCKIGYIILVMGNNM